MSVRQIFFTLVVFAWAIVLPQFTSAEWIVDMDEPNVSIEVTCNGKSLDEGEACNSDRAQVKISCNDILSKCARIDYKAPDKATEVAIEPITESYIYEEEVRNTNKDYNITAIVLDGSGNESSVNFSFSFSSTASPLQKILFFLEDIWWKLR